MPKKLTGLPRPLFHPAYLVFGFLVFVVIGLGVLRYFGFFAPRNDDPKIASTVDMFSRAYVPLGTLDGKLFYYDRQDQKICEYEKKVCNEHGAIPSVEAAVISPDLKKIALLTTKEAPKSGIYILDLSTSNQAQVSYIAKAEWLPTGYSFQPNSSIHWSQESKQIAFIAYKDSHADIFVVPSQLPPTQPSDTSDPIKQVKPDQQTKRIEPLPNRGSKIGAIIWRGEQSLIFVTELDGRDKMYEVGSNGGGIIQLKPN